MVHEHFLVLYLTHVKVVYFARNKCATIIVKKIRLTDFHAILEVGHYFIGYMSKSLKSILHSKSDRYIDFIQFDVVKLF